MGEECSADDACVLTKPVQIDPHALRNERAFGLCCEACCLADERWQDKRDAAGDYERIHRVDMGDVEDSCGEVSGRLFDEVGCGCVAFVVGEFDVVESLIEPCLLGSFVQCGSGDAGFERSLYACSAHGCVGGGVADEVSEVACCVVGVAEDGSVEDDRSADAGAEGDAGEAF